MIGLIDRKVRCKPGGGVGSPPPRTLLAFATWRHALNVLRDLHNSLHHTKAQFNSCLFIHLFVKKQAYLLTDFL